VSVTQQFNTTTSMGRLTLNVLLSFPQFEREVIGERIRAPTSSYCTASGRDSSDWKSGGQAAPEDGNVWGSGAKLRLRSGTPCLRLEVSTAQGKRFARDSYLHQSRTTFAISEAAPSGGTRRRVRL
jgi:hypothetical protein